MSENDQKPPASSPTPAPIQLDDTLENANWLRIVAEKHGIKPQRPRPQPKIGQLPPELPKENTSNGRQPQ